MIATCNTSTIVFGSSAAITTSKGIGSGRTRLGYVSQPNYRGTVDIIWTCVITLGICVWAMLHLNVPVRTDSELTLFLRRVRWMTLAVLAPELVMLFAIGQWASAKRSVADMRELGHSSWTLVHAFFADSGGFMLHSKDFVSFPITAKQIHYLVKRGFLAVPSITKEGIWDKSKADRLTKVIAGSQALWLVAQVIARGIQHRPVTLLELSTVALITCTGVTACFWFEKPFGVEIPFDIYLEVSLARVLQSAGDEAKAPYNETPFDFIEPNVYTSAQLPFHTFWGVQERPLTRIPNDRDPRLHNLTTVLMTTIPTAAFSLLHLVAWDFDFPTHAELLLWRWSSVSMSVILGTYCTVEALSIVAGGYTTTGLTTLHSYKLRWPTNLLFFIPGFLYMCARFLTVIETIISLRLLPIGCYETVEWTNFIPHF